MTVSIYQIQYANEIIGGFDPSFIKYDCRANSENEKREIAHMQKFFDEGMWKNNASQYVGLVSPKFNDKSKLSGDEFIKWINKNPGYDVYFINPFPQLRYFHFNVWEQGEYWHPGLLERADFLFKSAGLDIQTAKLPRNSSDTLLYSNYWVANEFFWEKFMRFVCTLTTAIDRLENKDQKEFFALAPHYAAATFYPFIFERMFSTFLSIDKSFRCLAYPYEKNILLSRCTNDFERLIVNDWSELIDKWDADNRNDYEIRKVFTNLEDMQKLFSIRHSHIESLSNSHRGLWSQLNLHIRNVFRLRSRLRGLVR
ncbi:hypothetical protein HZU77_001475 [Neisseriaceae bacterium TC5R-5]|nr:hypothetical protein [Neisseriaceae bacterium TC5R-5]